MTARLLRTTLALLSLGLFAVLKAATISCRNEEGDAVDWFIFYKLPKRQDKESGETGLQYLYLDSTIRSWRRSEQLMNTTESALGRTLQPLYEAYASKSNSTAYLIYNDGAPTSANYSRKYGHTKVCVTVVCGDACLLSSDSEGWNTEARESQVPGQPQQLSLLLWNRIQGFWLIHSIPRFPPIPEEGYNYPSTGRRNGQSGICITFKYNQYEAIDIFAAWMAQELKIHLLTETWQRKRQELPSNCSLPYHVYNIKAIKISRQSYFGSYQDHAKWCISQKGTKTRWTCIGDLNRSPYQAFRSGGFICTQNRHIYQAFQRLVLYYEDCN
ncbi:deoxyribonuclease-2-beta isoform X4 [Sciurus carolinensis]|uniref:deoxyribonuclease-2-beta isoform X4 n=1 Tax=Sciurus carolinensis TaxID=30640 RepID=UPI001FB1E17F|nr:deoxyribonuclease-2-beta isoform X4 [Sciurus carolinensis]